VNKGWKVIIIKQTFDERPYRGAVYTNFELPGELFQVPATEAQFVEFENKNLHYS